jgi:hypothetical protein
MLLALCSNFFLGTLCISASVLGAKAWVGHSWCDLMSDADDPVLTFFTAVSDQLEEAVENFKARRKEAAIDALEKAVELCEKNPAYALRPSEDLGSSLHQVVHGCISNAIAKGHANLKTWELLARIEDIKHSGIH